MGEGRSRAWVGVCLVHAVLVFALCNAGTAAAQDASLKVAVLRATSVEAGSAQPDMTASADSIDAALLRDLAGIAGIVNPTVSPVEYSEIQLTVGCEVESRACLAQIATTIAVDAIVVRRLQSESATAARVELVYFDASSSDEPVRVSASKATANGETAGAQLVREVPGLVRKLFGIPETASAAEAAAAPEPTATKPPPSNDDGVEPAAGGGVRPITWVVLGVGTASLVAGAVVGVLARGNFDDYKNTKVNNTADAKRADASFKNAKTEGLITTILLPVGIVGVSVGAIMLALDLSDDDSGTPARAKLDVTPVRGGGVLTLRGAF